MRAREFLSEAKCPSATQDITLNLKNRQKAINEFGYGPLNPLEPNRKFWMKKVAMWNLDTVDEAKKSLCGNCAAFDITEKTIDCIERGIGTDQGSENPHDVVEAGQLGYCRFLKFKCAALRTCDAWVVGGPIQDKLSVDEGIKSTALLTALIAALSGAPAQAQDNLVAQQPSVAAKAIGIMNMINNLKRYNEASLEGEARQELNNILRAVGGHPNQSKLYPLIKDAIKSDTQELPPLLNPEDQPK